jgi:tRNA uridine 5-carboxymethylaminomethyl modification enzyme
VDKYEIIVIGGGHAGVEAAAAAARMGAETCLITHSEEKIGEMSCNPAIGGIGKSHLAKEVDALGGLMARAADMAGIHYRVLNSTKGQAVRATRVQTDRDLYRSSIQKLLRSQANLVILESSVEDIIIKNKKSLFCSNRMRKSYRGQESCPYHRHLFRRSHAHRIGAKTWRQGR